MDKPPIGIYDDLSDLYDDLHPGREDDLLFYGSLLPHPGAQVLDVACGTGEIACRLAAAGAAVTGLDASEAMLTKARQRQAPVRWLLGDMRAISLPERFDLAVCGLNSMQHLATDADILQAMGCIADHLAPGGRFAFDIFNPADMFLSAPRHHVLMRRFFSTAFGRELALYEDTHYDPATLLLHIAWKIEEPGSGRLVAESRSTMRQIFPAALDALLVAAGFVTEKKFGDFTGTPFEPDHPRQIVLARRA